MGDLAPLAELNPMHSRKSVWQLLSVFVWLVVAGLFGSRGCAQCSTHWVPGDGLPSTNGDVLVTRMWDQDGAGPRPPLLVVAGNFTVAGRVAANRIATYDAVSGVWAPLGSGMNEPVTAVAAMPNGDLIAGGWFTTAGGVSANFIARWNGTAWSALGAGMGSSTGLLPIVESLTVMPNGHLIAGGVFQSASGVAVNRIARWDGLSWSALGLGIGGPVHALTTMPNGDLVAGGEFATAGGMPASQIARWDGTSWSALGSGVYGGYRWAYDSGVRSLVALSNGDLIAAGDFSLAGAITVNNVARWDGVSWSALGAGLEDPISSPTGRVNALAVLPNVDLVAGGEFTVWNSNPIFGSVARWDGANWSALSALQTSFFGMVSAMVIMPNGDLIAGGYAMTGSTPDLARYDGVAWNGLGVGIDGPVSSVAALPNGDMVIGGSFTRAASGIVTNYVARSSGATWSALGAGMDGPVSALATLTNGDIVAGGSFTTAGGVPAAKVARWSGTSWASLGSGVSSAGQLPCAVAALAPLPDGGVVAGGCFTAAGGVPANNIARWDGTAWAALGSGTNGTVSALAVMPNGDIIAGGSFWVAGGASAIGVARWNGSGWAAMGAGVNGDVAALAILPNGDLVAGGRVYTTWPWYWQAMVARWNGQSWAPLGSGLDSPYWRQGIVAALAPLPNGDLVAGGFFELASGVAVNNIARWSGANWSAFGSGVGAERQVWRYNYKEQIRALAPLPNGDLVAGGDFWVAGGHASVMVARLTTTCPAAAVGHQRFRN